MHSQFKTKISTRLQQGAWLSLAKLVLGLLKIKLLAILIGVEGVGILSLALQFQSTAVTLVAMTFAVAIINLGRPFVVQFQFLEAGEIVGTALSIVTLNAVIFVAFFSVFHDVINIQPLHPNSQLLITAVVVSAIISAYSIVIFESMAFLIDRYDIYVKVNIASSLFDVLVLSFGAWYFGVKGAIFAILINSVIQLLLYFIFMRKVKSFSKVLRNFNPRKIWVKPLFGQIFGLQFTALLVQISPLVGRAHIVAVSGEAVNGYLQVVTALAAYLLPFTMNGVHGHLHPFVAARGDVDESRQEFRATLLKLLPLSATICILMVLIAPLLLPIVYTKDFLPAQSYFKIYLLAEILTFPLSVISIYLIAIKNNKLCFIGHGLYHALLLLMVFLGVYNLSGFSYVFGHLIATMAVTVVAIVWGLKTGLFDYSFLVAVGCPVIIAEICIILEIFEIDLRGTGLHISWLAAIFFIFIYGWPKIISLLKSTLTSNKTSRS